MPQSTFPCRTLLAVCLLQLFLTTTTTQASFLLEPKVSWTHSLPGSGSLSGRGLRQGNEVLVGEDDDGNTLFVTADDGSLHLINTERLDSSIVYEPETPSGTSTESTSGVTLVRDPISGAIQYAVYAVIDVPIGAGVLYDDLEFDPSRSSTLSRLLAVNLDGSLRWSLPLNGAVVGKAVVGGEDNDMLYVVHNVPNLETPEESAIRGQISVVLVRASRPVVTASLAPPNRNGPLGPPAGTTATIDGTRRDVIVISEAWNNGYLSFTSNVGGNVYMLKPSSLYDDFDGQGNDAYEVSLVSDWSLPSVTRPAVTRGMDGGIFIGAAAASLGGWNSLSGVVSGDEENATPAWDLSLEPNKGNASQPLLVAPILSSDETVLYQAGASTEVYCIDAKTGDILWKQDGVFRSVIMAEPRLVERSSEEPKLFVIEGMKGKVRQHDALTGDVDWSFDCKDVSGGSCDDAVEADFSVSSNGNMVYYGDIFGKIVALEIAEFSDATVAPTDAPTKEGTVTPTKDETSSPTTITLIETTIVEDTTDSPTVAPPDLVVPDLVVPVPEETTEPPQDVEFVSETGSGTVVIPTPTDPSTTELEASSQVNNEQQEDSESFFDNQMMIILIGVCGGLAIAIISIMLAQRYRSGKPTESAKDDAELVLDEGNTKGWANGGHDGGQGDYEEECRRDEEETLREIVGVPTTPVKDGLAKQASKNKKESSPGAATTPATLASIEESPTECEVSFVSDNSPTGTPTRKNLDVAFVSASLPVNKDEARKLALLGTTSTAQELLDEEIPEIETVASLSMCSNNSAAQDLHTVEVVASSGASVRSQASMARRTMSPATVPEYDEYMSNANDLMSVDGSLYLDDDSLFQGRAEVGSLSQYSVASSTRDENSEVASRHSTMENGDMQFISANGAAPGAQYMQPPRKLSSPLLKSNLSPEVAEYLRKNQSISPNPMSPEYIDPSGATSPTSPISPLSDAGKSPQSNDAGRELAHAGSSVRRGGPGITRRSSSCEELPETDAQATSTSSSRSDSPPPQPPVETAEAAEPEDAWNSFLSELARAERDFFNPSFGGKKKTKENAQPERSQSPPPPPPPGSPDEQTPPPPPPPDPPVSKGRRRRQL